MNLLSITGIFIILMHVALPFLIFFVDNMLLFAVSLLITFYISHFLGLSLTYHKLFSHRSFVPRTWVAYLGTFINIVGGKGSPQSYAVIHRMHHKYADTDLDPHTPKYHWYHAYAFMFFCHHVMKKIPENERRNSVEDLFRDFPWIRKLTKISQLIIMVVFYTGICLISYDVFIAVIVANLFSIHVGCLINLIGHQVCGSTVCTINRPWLSTFLGPSFNHAQHHAHPGNYNESTRNSVDFLAWLIPRFLSKKI